MRIDSARETALKILFNINEKSSYTGIAINEHIKACKPDERDRAFISELVHGVVRWRERLDYVIEVFSKIRLKKLSPWIFNILRLGTYQLLFMDRVPQSAACNESVKLAGKFGHKSSSGYVNAVLRNIAANKTNIKYPDRKNSRIEYFSVFYSHPKWLVKRYLKSYDEEFIEKLLCANNEAPPFTIRTNTLRTTPGHLSEVLSKSGFECKVTGYVEEALVIDAPAGIFETEAFREGLFIVPDEGSMLVSIILDPRPGEHIIDVCAAPGGKSTHLAQLMKNKGSVTAWDIHTHRLRLIEQNSERLGTGIVKTHKQDASQLVSEYMGTADRVLIDAPCSGFGTIRRRPDIKWSRQEKDIAQLAKLQYEILDASAQYLKTGGVLVYAVCTNEPEENLRVVSRFLDRHGDFAACDFTQTLPESLQKNTCKEGYISLFPHVDGVDGFFVSKLLKKG
jgi:16S rRNA (cytosine967-C5)-methyltransferase